MRQALGGRGELPDDSVTKAIVIRETGRDMFGVSSGQRTDYKVSWGGMVKYRREFRRRGRNRIEREQKTVDRNERKCNTRGSWEKAKQLA